MLKIHNNQNSNLFGLVLKILIQEYNPIDYSNLLLDTLYCKIECGK